VEGNCIVYPFHFTEPRFWPVSECAPFQASGIISGCRFLDVKLAAWAQSPPEHQEATGGDPATGDANNNECPLTTQGDDKGSENRDHHENGKCQSYQGMAAIMPATAVSTGREIFVFEIGVSHGYLNGTGLNRFNDAMSPPRTGEGRGAAPTSMPIIPPLNHAIGTIHRTRRAKAGPRCPTRSANATTGIRSSGLKNRRNMPS
jgi:hypothetical protein